MYSDTDRILYTWRATRVEGERYKGIGIERERERRKGTFDTLNEPRLVRTLRCSGGEGRGDLVCSRNVYARNRPTLRPFLSLKN